MKDFFKHIMGLVVFLFGAVAAWIVTAVLLDNSDSNYRRYITLRRGENEDGEE